MFFYLFKIIIIFYILFFFLVRPINESLLENHLVPYLNHLFLNHSDISFDYKTDNLIFMLNGLSYSYSLPFNEYYILFFVIFFQKIFLKGYLHFHILNFKLILAAPLLYYCILYKLYNILILLLLVQSTINFYFLIYVVFDFLTKFGPKSFIIGLEK